VHTEPHHAVRLRDRIRDEISAAILAAAEEVIADEGLFSARIERIAARAGVSVGTIYNHFKDRTALVQALFDSRGEHMRASLDRCIAAVAAQPARAQVGALLRAMVEHGQEHGRLMGTLMKENHGPTRLRPPALSRTVLADRCNLVVERGISSGEFREDPHGVFAEALTALARQALTLAVEGRATAPEIDALTELFVLGVAR
jgi:AcrR family transcriptional regulator